MQKRKEGMMVDREVMQAIVEKYDLTSFRVNDRVICLNAMANNRAGLEVGDIIRFDQNLSHTKCSDWYSERLDKVICIVRWYTMSGYSINNAIRHKNKDCTILAPLSSISDEDLFHIRLSGEFPPIKELLGDLFDE